MSERVRRARVVAVIGGVLAFVLPPGGLPAQAADTVPVPVANGDFALPVAPPNGTAAGHTDWSPDGGQVVSKELAKHPDNLQAAALNWGYQPLTLRTRLWGVKTGSTVTLAFDDSPGTYSPCKLAQVQNGQSYTVSVNGAENRPRRYTTKGTAQVGQPAWTLGRTYEFTAAENNPLVSFVSNEDTGDNKSCGALLTHVTAAQTPIPVDTKVRKDQLPLPEAYRFHDVLEPSTAVDECNGSDTSCVFVKDARYSFQYYDKTRIIGEAYINCTRNPITDDHPVSVLEQPWDSISQYYVLKNPSAPLVPSRSNIQESKQKLAKQVEAGFTVADGNPAAVNTNNPLVWSRTTLKKLNPTVQPGEVSWIEVQAARERVSGTFVSTKGTRVRLDAVFDTPSTELPDRYYQRTGPLTQVELDRCDTARPTAVTPNNLARSGRSGLIGVGAPPVDARTVSVPLGW